MNVVADPSLLLSYDVHLLHAMCHVLHFEQKINFHFSCILYLSSELTCKRGYPVLIYK